jgi:DNA-binding NarL/FixJ family response regulator
MKLMIVDDHEGVRRMIRYLVAAPGDAVRECETGDEAVEVAPGFQPDCVTMDIGMPGQCAFAATRAILAARPDARVIVVTSYDKADLRKAAEAAGAAGYVVKDDLTQLPYVITAVLANRK